MADGFDALYRHLYNDNDAQARDCVDTFEPDMWRPLKCNTCGALVTRFAHRRHGNPYCNRHYPGTLGMKELVYLRRPFLIQRR